MNGAVEDEDSPTSRARARLIFDFKAMMHQLYVIIMSSTHFRVNPHSIVA